MRFAVDIGGTFTDLIVAHEDGRVELYKTPTIPEDPVQSIVNVLDAASQEVGIELAELLRRGKLFTYATTRALNAIITGAVARTALITTRGHPDILLFREGGRASAFNFRESYPEPYVPRALTFEVTERVGSSGEVVVPLDQDDARRVIDTLSGMRIEAVGVCLLWSIVNPNHELQLERLLEERLPGTPVTLSHQCAPAMREYRRASATCIDASLKPIITAHLRLLKERLRKLGFQGRLLAVTSIGGVIDVDLMARSPIHSIYSGPAVAPVAGRVYAARESEASTAIIADAGGTTYDVSLVRRGRIPWTREKWIGKRYVGHITGFPSVDVRSIGAGGGSVAWVDEGGLLKVGPHSAGAVPGPACYGRGGRAATVTDASVALGYISPTYFLGGKMALDSEAGITAIEESVAGPLGLDVYEAAAAVLEVVTEQMVHAIEEITLWQGVDTHEAVLVAGGGAAGLNAVAIARRLGCPKVIIPELGAALSAAGAIASDLTGEHEVAIAGATDNLDLARLHRAVTQLEEWVVGFIERMDTGGSEPEIEYLAEARYPQQIWDLEIPLHQWPLRSHEDLAAVETDFHATHEEVFGIRDPGSRVELTALRTRVRCGLGEAAPAARVVVPAASPRLGPERRLAFFGSYGLIEVPVRAWHSLNPNDPIDGPAVIEAPFTTIVVDHGARAERRASGNLTILPK